MKKILRISQIAAIFALFLSITALSASDGPPMQGGTVIKADSSLDCHLGMGRLKNAAAPTVNNPVNLTLINGSTWTATGTSYISRLVIDKGSYIKAEQGAITMTVNGAAIPIKAGAYEGKIVIATK